MKNYLVFNKISIKQVIDDENITRFSFFLMLSIAFLEAIAVVLIYNVKKNLIYFDTGRLGDINKFFENTTQFGRLLALFIDTTMFVLFFVLFLPLGFIVMLSIYKIKVDYKRLFRLTSFSYVSIVFITALQFIAEITINANTEIKNVAIIINVLTFIDLIWFISLLSYSLSLETQKSIPLSVLFCILGTMISLLAFALVDVGLLFVLKLIFEIL